MAAADAFVAVVAIVAILLILYWFFFHRGRIEPRASRTAGTVAALSSATDSVVG